MGEEESLQNVGDLNTKLVLAVENLKSFPALGNETVTVDQDTIDVKGKSHVLGLLHFLALNGLNLSCQQSS